MLFGVEPLHSDTLLNHLIEIIRIYYENEAHARAAGRATGEPAGVGADSDGVHGDSQKQGACSPIAVAQIK